MSYVIIFSLEIFELFYTKTIENVLIPICPSRSSWKPPLDKGSRKTGKKRASAEDDELDPMDPSSYSDAPRGGWYGYITHTDTHIYLSFELIN